MYTWRKCLGLMLVLCMLCPLAALSEDAGGYETPMVFQFASDTINESVDYNADDLSMYFRDKFNFTWDLIALTNENAAEKIRIWINSGDMPDIIVNSEYNHGEYTNYVEQGLLYRFPDDWKDRWPNAAAAFEDSVIGDALAEMHGGTYLFPRPIFSRNKPIDVLTPHYSVYLRKDWAEAVGFEIKDAYTTSEILEFARLVKEQDPGGVGARLIPIASRPSYALHLFTLAGSTFSSSNQNASDFFKDADGVYKWGPATEDTLAGLELYRQAYDEGLLHPEFYTYAGDADVEDFYIGGIAAVTVNAGMASYFQATDNYMQENLGVTFEDAVHVAAVLGDDGKYHAPEVINYAGMMMFSPNIEEEKFERFMDLLDYAATEEGQLTIRLGFEGVDWDYDENGEFVTYYAEGESARTKYPSIYPIYHRLVIMSDDFSLINPSFKKEFRERAVELYKIKEANGADGTIVPTDWDAMLFTSDAKNRLSFEYRTEYAMLVTGSNDMETEWNNWVSSNAYMIDPVLEELNGAFGN